MGPDGDFVNGSLCQSRSSDQAAMSSSSKASSPGSDGTPRPASDEDPCPPAMIDHQVDRRQRRMRAPVSSSSKASSPGTSDGGPARPASDEDGTCPPGAMADHHHVDRRQRRMLSNRESARRSRLRKQQHLDELRSLVAQLQAQNTQMLSSFNLASNRFSQVAEENRVLRSEALDLGQRLQLLHHALSLPQPNHSYIDEMHHHPYDPHPGLPLVELPITTHLIYP